MFLLALACRVEVDRSCNMVSGEVGLDEQVGDLKLTAADVLTLMVGEARFSGVYPDSEPVQGTVAVEMGDGPIMGTEGTLIEERRLAPGWALDYNLQIADCADSIEVPLHFALYTDDGAISVDVPGAASVSTNESQADGLPEFVHASATFTPEVAAAFPDAPPDSPEATVELQYSLTDFDFVSVWWVGQDYKQIFEAPAE